MQKTQLFTPGPTPVLPQALQVMSQPIMHHRTADFIEILDEVRAGLKELFGTTQEVLVLSSSGTGAMEGTVINLFSQGDKVMVVRGGKFGERWGEIVRAYGLEMIPIDVPWGEAPTLDTIREVYKKHPDAKALLLQACETSTGVDYPIQEIAAFTQRTDLLLGVDAISYVGVSPFEMDSWGVDVVVSGSQKGLMLPPGLAFAALNDRAWAQQKTSTLPKYYFNYAKELKNISKNQTAYTPAVSLVLGLREVLRYFKSKGKASVFNYYRKTSAAMRAAVQELQLELFAKRPSNGLVSVCVPSNLDGKKIVKKMRDEHHMMIAGGQNDFAGKIFRISCIGHMDPKEICDVFGALEKVLASMGAQVPLGKGVYRLREELV